MNQPPPSIKAVEEGRRTIPGEEGIWILVFTDLLFFGGLFGSYLYTVKASLLAGDVGLPEIDRIIGTFNTLVLLSSSWLVANAVEAVRAGKVVTARPCLTGALLCGCLFVGAKVTGYVYNIRSGFLPGSGSYADYYFVMTGIHLFHLLVGLIVLIWMRSAVSQNTATGRMVGIENAALYWHMVDLIWILLFPLAYLMPASR